MSSSDYKSLILKYEGVMSKISGLYSYLGNSASIVNKCMPLMEETMIDGESMDKGKLEDILTVLEELKEAFNTVIAECKLKVASYEILYAAALQAESSGTDDSSETETVEL